MCSQLERERVRGFGDALDPLALEGIAGRAAPEQQRRQEEPDFVDLAGVEKGARQARPALEQDRRHALRPELVERRAHAGRLVLACRHEDLGPAGLERVDVDARSGPRDDDRERHGRRFLHELGAGRKASEESKTTRRGWRFNALGRLAGRAVSRGSSASAVPIPTTIASTEARQRWASSRLDSPLIHFESPARVATFPSRVMADLKSTQGRPARACLRKAWLSSRARVASSPSAMTTSTPSSRRMPRLRPEAFSVGSSEPTTTRPMPAARIASVQGGVRPWWQQGSSETYSVAPPRS